MTNENDGALIHISLLQNNRILLPPLPSCSLPPSLSAPPSGSMVSGTAGVRNLIWVISYCTVPSLIQFIYELSWKDLLFMRTNGQLYLCLICDTLLPSHFPKLLLTSLMWPSLSHPCGCLDGIAQLAKAGLGPTITQPCFLKQSCEWVWLAPPESLNGDSEGFPSENEELLLGEASKMR